MADLTAIHEAIALALRGADPAEAVRVLCRSTAHALQVDGAAISTMNGTQHREAVCASDQVALELEELQFTLGDGPCFEAFDSNEPVLVPDLDDAEVPRWPVYASRAVERTPARAVFAFPLSVGSLRIGALSTYRTVPGPLDAGALAIGTDLAEIAALVMLDVEQDPGDVVTRLQREAAARGFGVEQPGHEQVHVAAGMLSVQLGLPVDAAFDRLRGHAFTEDRLLVDVAGDVLAHRLRLEP